jgi:hypothetical protein
MNSITMCTGRTPEFMGKSMTCPIRERCLRYSVKPWHSRQILKLPKYDFDIGKCEYFKPEKEVKDE